MHILDQQVYACRGDSKGAAEVVDVFRNLLQLVFSFAFLETVDASNSSFKY